MKKYVAPEMKELELVCEDIMDGSKLSISNSFDMDSGDIGAGGIDIDFGV